MSSPEGTERLAEWEEELLAPEPTSEIDVLRARLREDEITRRANEMRREDGLPVVEDPRPQTLEEFKAQALMALAAEANNRGWCSDFNDILVGRELYSPQEVREARTPVYTTRVILDVVHTRGEYPEGLIRDLHNRIDDYFVDVDSISIRRHTTALGRTNTEGTPL